MPRHPSLSMEVLETGIMPTLNKKEWISEEIPYSSVESGRVYKGKKPWIADSTWFFMQTKQPWQFTTETACMINPVTLDEVKEAIVIANALKSARSKGKLN